MLQDPLGNGEPIHRVGKEHEPNVVHWIGVYESLEGPVVTPVPEGRTGSFVRILETPAEALC
jgi:hypothetical protein